MFLTQIPRIRRTSRGVGNLSRRTAALTVDHQSAAIFGSSKSGLSRFYTLVHNISVHPQVINQQLQNCSKQPPRFNVHLLCLA